MNIHDELEAVAAYERWRSERTFAGQTASVGEYQTFMQIESTRNLLLRFPDLEPPQIVAQLHEIWFAE